ncbi:hypothetical protein BH20ACI1_BH20ACI1_16380 [soil metagenome]
MSKKFLFVIVSLVFAITLACSTPDTTNENVNAVSNVNMPPEFSVSPVPMSSLPPGIPDPNSNVNSVPKGTTPIPGIPDSKNLGKPLQKGPTPIPGIPDEVIKNNPLSNSSNNSKNEKKSPKTESNTTTNSVEKPPPVRKF